MMLSFVQVLSPHSGSEGFIADHCDGQLFKSHPLFQYEPNALQIITYIDEMEVSNPIGAHRGIHKLGEILMIHVYCWLSLMCIQCKISQLQENQTIHHYHHVVYYINCVLHKILHVSMHTYTIHVVVWVFPKGISNHQTGI